MRPPKPALSPPAESPFTGKTLGRCKIGRPIGRGATATVFHAHYLPLKRSVAVKILRADSSASPEARRKFVEEARALARLDHENVVRVFDVVEDEGYVLIIMDFVAGRSLKQVLDEDGALDPGDAVEVARQIALALDHAHGARILHRDVKPGNIILGDDGKAVLVDFGNAEAVGEVGDRRGTAHYVAPEVFQGKRQDEKTDTYSLGATLFHLVAGEPPYEGGSTQQILEAHEAGKLRTPSQVNPGAGIPKELDVLVKRSMASARGYRFAAKDFAEALGGVLEAVRAGPKRVRGRTPRNRGGTVRSAGPSPALLLGGVLLLAGAAIALVAAMNSGKKPAVVIAPPKIDRKPADPVAPPPAEEERPGPGIENRAEARAAREAEAAKALREAQEFAAGNPDKPRAVADRFDAVATEYAELSQGRLAREELKVWRERATPAADRAAVEAAKAAALEKEAKRAEEARAKVAGALAAMKFPEALAAHQETEPPPGRQDDWKRRSERLNYLIGFGDLLAEGLRGASLDAYQVRAGLGKPGEKVVGASAEGLSMKGPLGDRTVPWSDAKAGDVLAIGRKVLRNAPEPRLALACWCWENGMEDDARKEIDNALLTDRTGTASSQVQDLFGEL